MENEPLAVKMRPQTIDDIVGQDHLFAPGQPLSLFAHSKVNNSIILYGPPGTGKTSIASVIANSTDSKFVNLSAVSAKATDIRKAFDQAKKDLKSKGLRTIIFIDEIHRFSKSQIDLLLPDVETGTASLIGATTENPYISLNKALLSRVSVLEVKPLTNTALETILTQALSELNKHHSAIDTDENVIKTIASLTTGDARQALNILETSYFSAIEQNSDLNLAVLNKITPSAIPKYDKDGNQHYDIVSAFIKSMRGSDPDATLYWLAAMIAGGEDPRFIARRLIVHASEDVGMADPSVLPIAVAAAQAVALIGMPEARLNLAQAALAIATAPKSPATIQGIDSALNQIKQAGIAPVPKHLRDAHYKGASALGHGVSYKYPHNYSQSIVSQDYLPNDLKDLKFYNPTRNGFESTITARLSAIDTVLASRETDA